MKIIAKILEKKPSFDSNSLQNYFVRSVCALNCFLFVSNLTKIFFFYNHITTYFKPKTIPMHALRKKNECRCSVMQNLA